MLVWIDLETTGLDPLQESILEIGLCLTDDALQPLGWYQSVVKANIWPESLDPVVLEMHTKNGLLEAVKSSGKKLETVTTEIHQFLGSHTPLELVPAGSTVSFDRTFLRHNLPTVDARFHYRSVDVSSVKELCRRWRPELLTELEKDRAPKEHRVVPDLKDSIRELKFYRDNFFQISR